MLDRICYLIAVIGLFSWPPAVAQNSALNTSASFSTTNQSMWGSGEAFLFDYQQFVGLDVNPAPFTIGSGNSDQISVPVPLVGTYTANPYQQYDTDFKAGIEVGAKVSSGTINAQLDYDIQIAPDGPVQVGKPFSLVGSATKLGSSAFQTASPTAEAYIDGIAEAYVGGYVRIDYKEPGILPDYDYRMGNKGFTTNNTSNTPYRTLANINERAEVIGINRNGSGVIRYLGGTNLTDGDLLYDNLGAGSSVNLGPVSVTAGNFNVLVNGTAAGDAVSGATAQTLATVGLDIDQLIVGSPAFGASLSHDWGLFAYSIGYDIIDVNAALDVNFEQDFTIVSGVNVQLTFSEQVHLDGIGLTNSYTGAIDNIPEAIVYSEDVDIDVDLLINADLTNQTGLGFVGSLNTTLLEASANISWDFLVNAGSRGFSIGPVYEDSIPVNLGSIDVYRDTFALGGFNTVNAGTLTILTVPEPTSLCLLLGLGTLLATRRRQR